MPADDDMIIGARAIVTGKVMAIRCGFDDQHTRIFTYITVKVEEVLKGQITQRKIVIKELGGQVGDSASVVYGSPRFEKGERVLLYLDTWADGSLRTHQMFLGKFNIVIDPLTGQEIAVRSSPDENTTVLQPQLHGHGVRGQSTERQRLSAYMRMVRSRLAANWDRSLRFEADNYTNAPVLAEPNEYRSIAAQREIDPQFTFLGPYRFFEPDSGQPVTVSLNPNPSSQQGVPQVVLNAADVAAAGNAWSNVTGCSLTVFYNGTMDDCYVGSGSPGIHVISNNCDGRNGPTSGCASILAWGGVSQTGFQTRTINGTTFRQSIQGFVSMNPWASCSFGNNCNVQEILTHEIGHALGLGHSQFNDATMAPFAHFDGRCASIRTDDVNGIVAIYPGSGGGPGPLTITTSTLANGVIGSSYSQTLQASGGTPPYSWSIVAGLGNLPPGLSLNAGTGLISGNPTTAGTYNFTARVTDSVPTSTQKQLSIVVTAPGTPYDSQFISHNAPTSVSPGQTFSVNMKWLNTGTQTWSAPVFYMVSQNPAFNYTWLGGQFNAVDLGPYTVAPGQQLDFTFNAIAPTTPGTYNFQWQLYKDNGTQFFGQMSTNQVIQVGGGGGGGTNNAEFVSQSVPTSMTVGQTASVSVTMRNSGTTTWSAGTYLLRSLNPAGNSIWGLNQIALASSVAPGAQTTFTFSITAPSVAGAYNFQWGMLQSGVGTFGSPSTNVVVSVTSGGGGGGLNAQFISQNMPSTLNPGQSVVVTIQMKNNGSLAWSSPTTYQLGSQNPANNTTWGRNRASTSKWVPVGSTASFQFTVTAPSTPGTYNFQWQMWYSGSGFFGALTPNIAVQVGSGGGTNGAAFVSQNMPPSMTAGQSTLVSVTMLNTGTTTWTAPGYMLGSLNPQGNITWGLSQVGLGGLSVAPGAQATFSFNVTAPATPGTYNFQWGMMQSGVGYFGSASPNVAVTVSGGGGGGGTNDALFVSQNVPASLTTGQSANVSVTMMNSGTTTWSPGSYFLTSQNPPGNATWGLSQVALPSSVAPGASVTFSFTATAPAAQGTYNFQWQMNQSGAGYFGGASTNVAVSVTGSGTLPVAITTTSVPYGTRGVPYSAQIQVTGGVPPYTFSLTSGSLPAGVTLNGSTGLISGTPTLGGTFNFTVRVTDQAGTTASRSYKTFFR
jgi:hypothetical protein